MGIGWLLGIQQRIFGSGPVRDGLRGVGITLIFGMIAGMVLTEAARRAKLLPPPQMAETPSSILQASQLEKLTFSGQVPSGSGGGQDIIPSSSQKRALEVKSGAAGPGISGSHVDSGQEAPGSAETSLAQNGLPPETPGQNGLLAESPGQAGLTNAFQGSLPTIRQQIPSAEPSWAWVWYPGQWQKPPGMYYGRFAFTIDADVVSAYLFFSADNFATLYLNGVQIGGSGDWYTLKPVGVKTFRPLVRQGRNVLAVRVQNDDFEGGFILKGRVFLADGKSIRLDSDERWRCINQSQEGWEKPEFDDSDWLPSERIGAPPAGPWGTPTLPGSDGPVARLDVGDPESEKVFLYAGQGELFSGQYTYADGYTAADQGRRIRDQESFRLKLPGLGYLVLARQLAGGLAGSLQVFIDDQKAGLWQSDDPGAGRWAKAFFVVPLELTEGKTEVEIRLRPVGDRPYVAWAYEFWRLWQWYLLEEEAVGSQDLASLQQAAQSRSKDPMLSFRLGWVWEGLRQWPEAEAAYHRSAQEAGNGDLADAAWRRACLARAMQAAAQARQDPRRWFDLGLYLKAHRFYREAADLLGRSLALAPAWPTYDQLGEALLWAGRPVQEALKVWKEGLERFPPPRTNRWQGLAALRPRPEQASLVAAQKEQLQIMQDLIYFCSQGRMALELQMLSDPPGWDQLVQPGQMDTLIDIAGGAGGGSTVGPDVGPGHAAWSEVGFGTPWDVAWHEWLHQFECGLASSGNGQGWGGCHGSTEFGYRPPWWNWYRAAMRYYVQPGQYDRACIGDHFAAPAADAWLVQGPLPWPNPTPWWICYPGKRHEGHFAWKHRKRFHLDQLPQQARLTLTADNRLIGWFNGVRVIQHGSWMSAPNVDITRRLRLGENVLAVAVQNEDFGGGLLGLVEMQFPDRRMVCFITDASWKTASWGGKEFMELYERPEGPAPAWAAPDFNDAAWTPAEQIGRYPCPPWNRIQIALPDRLLDTLENPEPGRNLHTPSAADGWRPIRVSEKMIRLAEVGVSAKTVPAEGEKPDGKQAGASQGTDARQKTPAALSADPTDPDSPSLMYAFSYVYCPAEMRAQIALGSTWRAVVRLNGETVLDHAGNGLPWLPRVTPIWLKRGWNRLFVAAEDLRQEGRFWLKISQPAGDPIPGLKYSAAKPEADFVPDQKTLPRFDPAQPRYYRWADVAEDPYFLMPQLKPVDLAQYTGYPGLNLQAGNNFLFVHLGYLADVSSRTEPPTSLHSPGRLAGSEANSSARLPTAEGGSPGRLAAASARPSSPPKTSWPILAQYPGGEDRLNNALTWDHEPLCMVRLERDGKTRDLIFIKPDALALILETHLLRTPEADHPRNRILGWVWEKGRLCVAAETYLGDLPERTMDLLDPR